MGIGKLGIAFIALEVAVPMPAPAQTPPTGMPDLSGVWYTVSADSDPTQCTVAQDDIAHLVAINNGVNPVHIFTKNGRATEVQFGNGPLADTFFHDPQSCIMDFQNREAQFERENGTVDVEPDSGN